MQISIWIYSDAPYKLQIHPTQPRGGHPSHSNLVRGKLTSPTPNPAGDGTSGLTSYPRRRSKVSEATCLRPSRTRTRAVRPRVQRSDHWATPASLFSILMTSIFDSGVIWKEKLDSSHSQYTFYILLAFVGNSCQDCQESKQTKWTGDSEMRETVNFAIR